MYAVIETGGKQYRVQVGEILTVEKLTAQVGETVEFDQVLAVKTDEAFKLGSPLVVGAKVQAKVLEQGRDKKIIVYKYKPKKNYHKKQGHRQPFTRIKIEKIDL